MKDLRLIDDPNSRGNPTPPLCTNVQAVGSLVLPHRQGRGKSTKCKPIESAVNRSRRQGGRPQSTECRPTKSAGAQARAQKPKFCVVSRNEGGGARSAHRSNRQEKQSPQHEVQTEDRQWSMRRVNSRRLKAPPPGPPTFLRLGRNEGTEAHVSADRSGRQARQAPQHGVPTGRQWVPATRPKSKTEGARAKDPTFCRRQTRGNPSTQIQTRERRARQCKPLTSARRRAPQQGLARPL